MLQLKHSISIETYKFHQHTILCQIQIKPRIVQNYKDDAPKILHRWFDGATNWERFEAELHRILDNQEWSSMKTNRNGEFYVNPLIKVKYNTSPEVLENSLWHLKILNLQREDIALSLDCNVEYNEDRSCLCAQHKTFVKTDTECKPNQGSLSHSGCSPIKISQQSSNNENYIAGASFYSATSSNGNIITSPDQGNRERNVEHREKLQKKKEKNIGTKRSDSDSTNINPATKTSTEFDRKSESVPKRQKTSRHVAEMVTSKTAREKETSTDDETRKENRSRSRVKIDRLRKHQHFDSKKNRIENQVKQVCDEEQKSDKLKKLKTTSHSPSLSPFEETPLESGIKKQTSAMKPDYHRADTPLPVASSQTSDDGNVRRSTRTVWNTKRFLKFKADEYNKRTKLKNEKVLDDLFGTDDEDATHFVDNLKSETKLKQVEPESKVNKLKSRAESDNIKTDPKKARIESRSDSLNSEELDRLESERLDNLCAKLLSIPNLPKPPKVDILSLQDLTLEKVLNTFELYKSKIEEVIKDLRAKSTVNQYKGLSHLHVINLLNEDTQLKMMDKVAEAYSMVPNGKTTSLLMNAVVPTWTAHLFMDRYKMTRQEAVKHIIAQQDYGDYLKYEKEKINDSP